jgi:putative regulatory protein, FmdB family
MPIYEYVCADCGHTLEAIQKFSDAALTECPACHKYGLQKQISASAFHLKGTGWYVTDFKNKPKAAEETKKRETPAVEMEKPGNTSTTTTDSTEKASPAKKTENTTTE